jgi:hypothetical protein
MKTNILFFLACLSFCAGCATQEQLAKQKIQRTCNSLMGCSEEEVVLVLGTPDTIQDIGTLKVYKYNRSYGTRSTKQGSVNCNNYRWTTEEQQWEAYDKIEVFFRNGHVVDWKCSVKR